MCLHGGSVPTYGAFDKSSRQITHSELGHPGVPGLFAFTETLRFGLATATLSGIFVCGKVDELLDPTSVSTEFINATSACFNGDFFGLLVILKACLSLL